MIKYAEKSIQNIKKNQYILKFPFFGANDHLVLEGWK